MNFGTARWNLRKAPTNVLPPDTVMIDLLRSPEALLRRMKPKTRYNIRVSARRGVRVEQVGRGALDRELAVWYGLLEETARRHRILLGDYDYFRELLHLGTCVGRTPDARSVPVQDRVRRIRPAQARLLGLPSA